MCVFPIFIRKMYNIFGNKMSRSKCNMRQPNMGSVISLWPLTNHDRRSVRLFVSQFPCSPIGVHVYPINLIIISYTPWPRTLYILINVAQHDYTTHVKMALICFSSKWFTLIFFCLQLYYESQNGLSYTFSSEGKTRKRIEVSEQMLFFCFSSLIPSCSWSMYNMSLSFYIFCSQVQISSKRPLHVTLSVQRVYSSEHLLSSSLPSSVPFRRTLPLSYLVEWLFSYLQENQFLRITHRGEILRSMRLTVKVRLLWSLKEGRKKWRGDGRS